MLYSLPVNTERFIIMKKSILTLTVMLLVSKSILSADRDSSFKKSMTFKTSDNRELAIYKRNPLYDDSLMETYIVYDANDSEFTEPLFRIDGQEFYISDDGNTINILINAKDETDETIKKWWSYKIGS